MRKLWGGFPGKFIVEDLHPKKKKKTGHFVGAEKRKVRKRKEGGEVEKETTGDKKGNRQARLRKKGWYCEKKGWFMETTRKGWLA